MKNAPKENRGVSVYPSKRDKRYMVVVMFFPKTTPRKLKKDGAFGKCNLVLPVQMAYKQDVRGRLTPTICTG